MVCLKVFEGLARLARPTFTMRTTPEATMGRRSFSKTSTLFNVNRLEFVTFRIRRIAIQITLVVVAIVFLVVEFGSFGEGLHVGFQAALFG